MQHAKYDWSSESLWASSTIHDDNNNHVLKPNNIEASVATVQCVVRNIIPNSFLSTPPPHRIVNTADANGQHNDHDSALPDNKTQSAHHETEVATYKSTQILHNSKGGEILHEATIENESTDEIIFEDEADQATQYNSHQFLRIDIDAIRNQQKQLGWKRNARLCSSSCNEEETYEQYAKRIRTEYIKRKQTQANDGIVSSYVY